jgi:isocitrate dehydrogenase (NAD+)
MLSSVMMLRHLKEREAADRIQGAIERVYAKGERLPRDVGGTASTAEFTDAVVREMAAGAAAT